MLTLDMEGCIIMMNSKLFVPIEMVRQVLASQVPPDASSNKDNSDYDQYDDESDSASIKALVLLVRGDMTTRECDLHVIEINMQA
jgi:hypothetical protein